MKKQLFVRDPAFYRQAAAFALPGAFQQTINIGVNLMDTVMVGSLGEAALSATSLANQYYNLYYILCLGLSGGACVLSAQYWGAGSRERVKQVWRFSLYIAAGVALLFSLLTTLCPGAIISIYTEDPAIRVLGVQYLRVTAAVYLFHGTSLVMVNLLRSVGAVRLGLPVSGVSFVVNILFNYMFIFGRWGAPCLGVAGAAVGTLLSRMMEFAITFIYLFRDKKHLPFSPRELVGPLEPGLVRTYLRVGGPALVSDGMYTVGDNLLSIILGHMSAAMVSANAITLTVMRLIAAFNMGLNVASGALVGQTIGQGDNALAQRQGNTFALLAALGGLLGGGVIRAVCPAVIRLYGLSAQTAAITTQLMTAMGLLMMFQTLQSVLSKGVLRGGGDTRFLMFADLVFLWTLDLPLGYLAGLVWDWPPFWVFICLRLDNICKTVLCLARLAGGKWIRNVNLEP